MKKLGPRNCSLIMIALEAIGYDKPYDVYNYIVEDLLQEEMSAILKFLRWASLKKIKLSAIKMEEQFQMFLLYRPVKRVDALRPVEKPEIY